MNAFSNLKVVQIGVSVKCSDWWRGMSFCSDSSRQRFMRPVDHREKVKPVITVSIESRESLRRPMEIKAVSSLTLRNIVSRSLVRENGKREHRRNRLRKIC